MTEYWSELENNHHYILVSGEHDRSFYCPAQDDANALAHILNNKNKTIRRLIKENGKLQKGNAQPVYEITRHLEDRTCHVAFVTDEDLAYEFCKTNKDCHYHQISITKYPLELELLKNNIPTCENCLKFSQGGLADIIAKAENKDGVCDLIEDAVNYDDYCSDWEGEE